MKNVYLYYMAVNKRAVLVYCTMQTEVLYIEPDHGGELNAVILARHLNGCIFVMYLRFVHNAKRHTVSCLNRIALFVFVIQKQYDLIKQYCLHSQGKDGF